MKHYKILVKAKFASAPQETQALERLRFLLQDFVRHTHKKHLLNEVEILLDKRNVFFK